MIVEQVKVETSESTTSVKALRQELKELRGQLLSTQQGTEEYNRIVKQAANIQHELKEQMAEINASAADFGQRIGNCTNVLAGLSGGITAATGVLSLFGVENEEAQKKIQATMTSLIGLTEGLSKIDEGVKAFKRLTLAVNAGSGAMGKFKLALISTGLGALVVVLGSIIANWKEFTEAIGISSKQLQHFGDIAKGVLNVLTGGMKNIAIAVGKLIKGDISGAVSALKDAFNVTKNFNEGVKNAEKDRADAAAAAEAERTKKLKEEEAKRLKAAQAAAKARAKAAEEAARKSKEAYEKYLSTLAKVAKYEKDMATAKLRGDDNNQYSQKNYEIQMKYYDEIMKIYPKDRDEYKQALLDKEQYLQNWDEHNASVIQNVKDGYKQQIDAIKEANKTEQQLLDEKYASLVQAAQGNAEDLLEVDKWYDEQQKEIDEKKAQDSAERKGLLNSILPDAEQEQIALDEQYQRLVAAAELEYTNEEELAQKIVEINKWKANELKKISDKEKNNTINTYVEIGKSVGNLFSSLGDLMKEGSEEQKGIQTASAVVSTIAGAVEAYMQAQKLGPITGPIIGALNAATCIATGVAQIAKINSVNSDGSNAESVVSSASSATGTINMSAVAAGNTDLLQSVDGATTTAAIQDQKVYVTEHDITTTQNKVKVAQANATY